MHYNDVKRHSDKLNMRITIEDNIWLSNPQWSRQAVITVSRHDLEDHKYKNGVAIDLFCTGVIGHPGHMFLN